ncbi:MULTISPECIES: DNA methyltransferase [Rhodococcus]|uniref:DNA methyltransferase n=1 Tax=Rhodococcus TaxID=1827 RepID=UPI00295301A3|nr:MULTISPECIES: DNA methyltransferase [Rhodococcus]MDV7246236.1 DNA methyltransferase [Rhodococcus oxybenzonivorans]MDV7337292.1 DNA methyltransferase [Rhodococcus oxybenzonivorans]MDV8030720.1 DNA methyltransferase [Rhodococcus sp. IEGM 27]
MTRTARRPRTRGQSSTTEWLELLAVDGPFLAAPVVKDVWPGGLPALNKDDVSTLRETSSILDASPGTRDTFIRHVLTNFLGWKANHLGAGHVPPTLTTPVPEYGTEVRPDFALLTEPDDPTSPALLLGLVLDPGVRATARPHPGTPGTGKWPASYADRLGHALRARKVPLGLVTDGTEWTLVCAPTGGATTTATWTRHTWFDEPDTLKAFAALLGRLRFFGVPEDQTLPALLAASLDRQEEITTRLSEQSQAVVEMLVATIGRLDAEHRAQHGAPLLPAEVEPAEVYQGAVTVLMRMVFLLYAEERGLLPIDDDTYADAYAISTLAAQLREHASDVGEDTLERSSTAWHRMLATFRAVHRGARHDQFALPGYGGSLFDPDRFPWLEGRPDAAAGLDEADPLPIDDRTLLRALEALQWLRFAGERRHVSFRVLDVEQIGYVYEGLLDQDARRAYDWILGIAGDSKGEKDGPEIPLTDLIEHLDQGAEHFATWLSGAIKAGGGNRSPAAITKTLTAPTGGAADTAWTGVLEACGGDETTAKSILPFAKLLRRDPRDLPVIYPPGSLYLTDSELRAHTGAVYTPRALAEQVVERTLEPLVKSPGPLDTEDESAWRIRTPEQILALKVIDIAVGSGAFLVAATRYLADRLLDARRIHEPTHEGIEIDDEQAVIDARRQILDHCIYGVDINPMALEMAKLSLWLVTLDRTRPFGFLDDRLAVGDSLLGLTSPEQLLDMHLDPREGRKVRNHEQIAAYTADLPGLMKQSAALRQRIADIDLIDSHSAEHKARLLTESQQLTQRLTVLADALSGASLSGGTAGQYGEVAAGFGLATSGSGSDTASKQFESNTEFALTDERGQLRRPAHFPLLFPEVFASPRTGFDAVVGNPPFLGGKKLTGAYGVPYREHLVRAIGHGVRGHADLIAYMFLTAASLCDRDRGSFGLIGTNTVAQGDTREVGLDQITDDGFDIYAAVKSEKWPTKGAKLEYSIVWSSRHVRGDGVLASSDGHPVQGITPSLDAAGRATGNPHRLADNKGRVFIGSYVLGLGFTMDQSAALGLIERDPRNADVLFPYAHGEDLNSRPDSSGSRWIINYFDWPKARAQQYPDCFEIVEKKVRPERQRVNESGEYVLRRPLPERYWQYADKRPALYRAIKGLTHVLAIALVSKVVMPVRVPTGQVFSHQVAIFTTDDFADLALLSSAPHYWWAITRASTIGVGAGTRYTPSDVFETLPRPVLTDRMRSAGEALDRHRREFMLDRQLGLTKTYNLLHDPTVADVEVAHLRAMHVEVDQAVCAAYGWDDLPLDHAHHDTRQGVRWTVSPVARLELLDRLLELNQVRYAEERAASTASPVSHKKRAKSAQPAEATLFDTDEDA